MYAEYEEVISRPRLQRSPDIIAGALQAIRDAGLWVRPAEQVKACSDPDDNIFLECAQAARADYVVTGNIKHFRLHGPGPGLCRRAGWPTTCRVPYRRRKS
jgi:uncharacterized protein